MSEFAENWMVWNGSREARLSWRVALVASE